MTLDTQMSIRTDRSAAEVHSWINKNLLATAEIPEPRISDRVTDDGSIWNVAGQGLAAWLITKDSTSVTETWEEYYADDAEYYDSLDAEELAEKRSWFERNQAGKTHGSVLVSFDTAYSYRDSRGLGCTELHATYLLALLKEFGETAVAWQNEYSGEWTIGWDTEAVQRWLGSGDEAFTWFTNVVKPAIEGGELR